MKKFILFTLLTLFSTNAFAEITSYKNYNSKSVCNDGAYSSSSGRGSCSHHGGVAYSL